MKPALDPTGETERKARHLYWQGWRMPAISEELGVKAETLHSWKKRYKWRDANPVIRVTESVEARLVQLVNKEQKTGQDFKEIDLLGRQMERLARVHKYTETGKEADLNPNILKRNEAPKKKPRRNYFTEEQAAKLKELFQESLFGYQRAWFEAGQQHRIRDILKSRQIGATWYFAFEALVDAVETGRNQIFLSASKSQAHVFKHYIMSFAQQVGVDLSGDPIAMENGAHLYFLGTNSRTAQSYHGNLYFDEYFWVYKFQELRKVASGMAMHKKWRQTYISTPSAVTHDAYPFWTGSLYNRGKPKDKRVEIDVSHASLAAGRLCEDGQWRQIVTVEDAVEGGCDLFDLDQLRLEYSDHEYSNLLMCQFIDDTLSVFPLAELQRCMVDSWVEWSDFKPFAERPFADRPVWVGYDPALYGDSAGLVVLAPPAVVGAKFRVLEKHQFKGMDFAAQSKFVKSLTEKYNVNYIGIDATGVGQGVYQLVKEFFPAVQKFIYSPEVKSRLVLKAKDVITSGRLEFDAGWTDFAQSFMAIRKTITASGRQITYQAGRTDDIGHSDLAWACMHALANEPLSGESGRNKPIMEIY